MKVQITRDEWFPVYGLDSIGSGELTVEVDKKFYEQVVKNENDFLNFQVKLEKLYERARKKQNKENIK